MTHTKTLEALLEKVESGKEMTAKDMVVLCKNKATEYLDGMRALQAYNGSLSAALALHKALLVDRWLINLAFGYCHVFPAHDNGEQESITGTNEIPSRAWLTAIIKALISEEKRNDPLRR